MSWCRQVTNHYLSQFDSNQYRYSALLACNEFMETWYGRVYWIIFYHFRIMQKVFSCHTVIILETAAQLRMEMVTVTFSNIPCNSKKSQTSVNQNMFWKSFISIQFCLWFFWHSKNFAQNFKKTTIACWRLLRIKKLSYQHWIDVIGIEWSNDCLIFMSGNMVFILKWGPWFWIFHVLIYNL